MISALFKMLKSSWWFFFYYILKKHNCIIVFIYKKAFEMNKFFNKLYEKVHFLLEMIIIIFRLIKNHLMNCFLNKKYF